MSGAPNSLIPTQVGHSVIYDNPYRGPFFVLAMRDECFEQIPWEEIQRLQPGDLYWTDCDNLDFREDVSGMQIHEVTQIVVEDEGDTIKFRIPRSEHFWELSNRRNGNKVMRIKNPARLEELLREHAQHALEHTRARQQGRRP